MRRLRGKKHLCGGFFWPMSDPPSKKVKTDASDAACQHQLHPAGDCCSLQHEQDWHIAVGPCFAIGYGEYTASPLLF